MPNANRPMGLKPVGYGDGSPWNGQATTYYISSGDANAYAIGDPVVLAGSGDGAGVPDVTLATAGFGNLVLGVIVSTVGSSYGGAQVTPSNLDTTIIPATKTRGYYVLVADDPNILFEIQESTNSATPLAQTDLGNNFDLVAGTNNGYVSGWQLKNDSANTGATRQLKLLRLARRSDNTIGVNANWIVRINNHQFSAGVAGV